MNSWFTLGGVQRPTWKAWKTASADGWSDHHAASRWGRRAENSDPPTQAGLELIAAHRKRTTTWRAAAAVQYQSRAGSLAPCGQIHRWVVAPVAEELCDAGSSTAGQWKVPLKPSRAAKCGAPLNRHCRLPNGVVVGGRCGLAALRYLPV